MTTHTYKFEIVAESKKTKARAGILHTPHGKILTPTFMPVGTQATVKGLTPDMLLNHETQIILANTYHLSLRPGIDVIKSFGGLHEFMQWPHPILTDSGGYQVFSLSSNRKINPDGVTFKSHIDGSAHTFTPQSVIDLQLGFNSDIMMPLDICSSYENNKKQTLSDMKTTHQWAKTARDYWQEKNVPNWLFGISQGGFHKELRQESIAYLNELDFPGYAIGGLSVGEPLEELHDFITYCSPQLPKEKPRYVMGIGLPENLECAIDQGIDMFDCVIPTRLARHGQVFIGKKRVNIKLKKFKQDTSPIDPTCTCYTCKQFSKAYLRHLFIAKELLAYTLLSIHNIHTINTFVLTKRKQILTSSPT